MTPVFFLVYFLDFYFLKYSVNHYKQKLSLKKLDIHNQTSNNASTYDGNTYPDLVARTCSCLMGRPLINPLRKTDSKTPRTRYHGPCSLSIKPLDFRLILLKHFHTYESFSERKSYANLNSFGKVL